MLGLPDYRAELEAVAESDTFARTPNLARLLVYLCNKTFQGKAGELKEYNVAVEALARRSDFDPAASSIVRVEMHRLRARLKKYYEAEGLAHRLMIVLESGCYTPQFVERDSLGAETYLSPTAAVGALQSGDAIHPAERDSPVSAMPTANAEQAPAPGQAEVSAGMEEASRPPSPASSVWAMRPGVVVRGARVLALAAGLLLLGGVSFVAFERSGRPASGAPASSALAAPNLGEVRIVAGYSREKYIDREGRVWGPDRYYAGGTAWTPPPALIARTQDQTLYETARIGDFSYDIPLKPGWYELRLYFAETTYGPGTLGAGGESTRVFQLYVNGSLVLPDVDIIREAGGNNTAYVRVFKGTAPASDGRLHLQFRHLEHEALVNAIEVIPGERTRLAPIRIAAQQNSYTDENGQVWSPDRYFQGGMFARHPGPVRNTSRTTLYSSERYGSFSYAIPVAPGRYTIRVHFAETYFGEGNPGQGGAGSRVFDLYCNGGALLRNFDILKQAGGPNRALVRTFGGLEPNAAGLLILSFVPSHNYACVNAIEVIDESQ